jgi:di/tricarboxylate transporter
LNQFSQILKFENGTGVQLFEDLHNELVYLTIHYERGTRTDYLFLHCTGKSKLPPDWEKWVMLVVVVTILFLLIASFKDPYFIFLSAATLITLLDIISLKEFLSGFSNEGLITIAILFPVVKPVSKTGILQFISLRILLKRFPRMSLLIIMVVVAAFSIFFNNTPIVALFIPIIKDWCRKNDLSPSKYLIPLSYATIAGGMCSLIGTSTNLLVHGFLEAMEDQEGFGFFEVGYVGFPLCAFLISYMFVFAFCCLPDKKGGLFRLLKKGGKTFISEVDVNRNSPLRGKRVSKIKSEYPQVEFIEIVRKNDEKIERIVPVPENEIIETNDILIVSGEMDVIMNMINSNDYEAILNRNPKYTNSEGTQEEKIDEANNQDGEGEGEGGENQNIEIVVERNSIDLNPKEVKKVNEKSHRRFSSLEFIKRNKSQSSLDEMGTRDENRTRRSFDVSQRTSVQIDEEATLLRRPTLVQELKLEAKQINEPVVELENLSENELNVPNNSSTSIQASFVHSVPSNDPISRIKRFYSKFQNLFSKPKEEVSDTVEFFEVVIGNQSSVLGARVKDRIFQTKFAASIIAIRRNNENNLNHLQNVQFKSGDTLLLLAKSSFYDQWIDSNEFFVISPCNHEKKNANEKQTLQLCGKTFDITWIQFLSIPIFVGMIIAATTGVSMFICALVSLIVMIIIGIIDPVKAYQAVDWGLIILIASSFGIGKGIENSGLAYEISSLILKIPFPKYLIPSILFFMTQLMSSVITNNAAAAITFPFAVSLAKITGIDLKALAIAVASKKIFSQTL